MIRLPTSRGVRFALAPAARGQSPGLLSRHNESEMDLVLLIGPNKEWKLLPPVHGVRLPPHQAGEHGRHGAALSRQTTRYTSMCPHSRALYGHFRPCQYRIRRAEHMSLSAAPAPSSSAASAGYSTLINQRVAGCYITPAPGTVAVGSHTQSRHTSSHDNHLPSTQDGLRSSSARRRQRLRHVQGWFRWGRRSQVRIR